MKPSKIVEPPSTQASRRRIGKRMIAIEDSCKKELKKELILLFTTYVEALEKTRSILQAFPPNSRSRTLEASIVQSCLAEFLTKNFADKASYGKYKRLILSVNGYLVLFKKFNSKGLPMNIKTNHVQSILDQLQTLSLFDEASTNESPILYFGYQKNKVGAYVNPKLVYIDEGVKKFEITPQDIQFELPLSTNQQVQTEEEQIKEEPKLKNTANSHRKSS